jgi:salicylate hydroxylase
MMLMLGRLWTVHRADLQNVLYEAAKKRGIELRLGCPVVGVDVEAPAVLIKGGERIEGDLIVGADGKSCASHEPIESSDLRNSQPLFILQLKIFLGIKSVVRKSSGLDSECIIRDCGLDVTRANIPEDIMNSDPLTAECMRHIALYFGPATTVANVPIRRGMSPPSHQKQPLKYRSGDSWLLGYDFTHPRDSNSADGASRPQDIEHMKSYFKGFAPVIQKALSYVEEAHVWRMLETLVPSWVGKSGKVVLTGDAAHAVLPYVGQVIQSPSSASKTPF